MLRLVFAMIILLPVWSTANIKFNKKPYMIVTSDMKSTQSIFDILPKANQVRENIISADLSAEQVKYFSRLEGVEQVVFDGPIHLFAEPNDLDRRLWGLKNRNDLDIRASKAWDITTGSKDVIVAVIDTGADVSHPDLKDNLWVNQAELNGQKGVDDDGNGYIDDIHGYDMANNTADLGDTQGHGTHVSGTIGAVGNNNRGVVGVNWNSSLMILNMFPRYGAAKTSDAIKAIDYAVMMGAKVINASWGAKGEDETEPAHKLLFDAIDRAGKAGVTFVAAAGNDSQNNDNLKMSPANFPLDNIVSVGSFNSSGRPSYFSNYGKSKVHVFAPGSDIYSTWPGGRYRAISGTSMAAPHVTGIVALMLANDKTLEPLKIRNILVSSCEPSSSLKDRSQCQGFIDAEQALLK